MTVKKTAPKRGGKSWLLISVALVMFLIVMGLIQVWSNIERMDTKYLINRAQNELNEREAHRAKLEVERERLLSPYELKRKAQEFGMREATANQVRRLDKR